MDSILPIAGKELISSGILGVIIFLLIWYLGRKEADWKVERAEFELKLAAKDKRIEDLSDSRLADVKQLVEIAQGLRTQGQAFLAAIERKTS